MQKQLTLKLLPAEASDESVIRDFISAYLGEKNEKITGFHIDKRSIDARNKKPLISLSVTAFVDEPFHAPGKQLFVFKDVSKAGKSAIIIGAGPAGLFAALKLVEEGIKPIILERGKDVKARRRDLATLNRVGCINGESNYCFGEGGAGTYSDGKLYTRSTKRGDVNRILNLFVRFGAEENILYDAHPHIGTNKLPQIITAMRKQIIDAGGLLYFEKKVTDLFIEGSSITGVKTADGQVFEAEAVILATGHSARDVFKLLDDKRIILEAKDFALGVRVEHPQDIIDTIQYGGSLSSCNAKDGYKRSEFLPPASYSLVQQVNGKGVFSFCMCPGGIIAPASTNEGELVVNGWSPSKRNNPYANSGVVVTVSETDLNDKAFTGYLKQKGTTSSAALRMMYFQEMVERSAFNAGGGKFVAPAQRLVDFCENKISASLPSCSYLPGINSNDLGNCLPTSLFKNLQQGLRGFGDKMKGYYTNEAVIVATESRTSSPVRIPRDKTTLQHPQISNLYPCGEGAGYAGGIVSAAMDGEKIAAAISEQLLKQNTG